MIKKLLLSTTVVLALPASATLYLDSTGDLGATFSGLSFLDISSVEVTNDATDIMFTVNLVGDPVATDWGKYMIAIDSAPGGDPAGNGWNRPISMSSGMDYWIGSWVNAGNGAELYGYNAASWDLSKASYSDPPNDLAVPTKNTTSVTVGVPLSALGLSVGDSFIFDAFSSGGGDGDGAVDALANPTANILDWGDSSDSTSTLSYTVIPEPSHLALGLLGTIGLLSIRRRKN